MGLIKRCRHLLADALELWGHNHGLINVDIHVSPKTIIQSLSSAKPHQIKKLIIRYIQVSPTAMIIVYTNPKYWNQIPEPNRSFADEIIKKS
ncbi:MAG: hypothetical protein P1S59_14750 [bacterium]|nr:hypothetical protein [bacterium]